MLWPFFKHFLPLYLIPTFPYGAPAYLNHYIKIDIMVKCLISHINFRGLKNEIRSKCNRKIRFCAIEGLNVFDWWIYRKTHEEGWKMKRCAECGKEIPDDEHWGRQSKIGVPIRWFCSKECFNLSCERDGVVGEK